MTSKLVMHIHLGVVVVLALGFVNAVPVIPEEEPAIALHGIDGSPPEYGLEARYITFETTTKANITQADHQAVISKAKKWWSSRIFNGNESPNSDVFPNVAAIVGVDDQGEVIGILCTGSIIDEDIVLSAAHCVSQFRPVTRLVACAGTIDYFADNGVCNMVMKAAVPQAYKERTLFSGNDLSVLKLSGPMTGIPKMKVSFDTPSAGYPALAIGFGLASPDSFTPDGKLRYGDTVVVPSDRCRLLDEFGYQGDPDLICANGNHDGSEGTACFGDSGGPLLVPGRTPSEHIAIGVASWGAIVDDACHAEYENAYSSLTSSAHKNFLQFHVNRFGGTLPLTELSDEPPTYEIPTAESTDGCFPEDAVVTTEDGSLKTMEQLRAGDRVMVSNGRFSDVFGFGHRDGSATSEFVRIEATSGHAIELTAGHYVVIDGALLAAKDVMIGNVVTLYDGSTSKVEKISLVNRRGLYNPHTLEGTIVVNNVLASTYTQAVNPMLAHLMLSLPRLAYRLGMKEPLGSVLYDSTPAFLRTIARSSS